MDLSTLAAPIPGAEPSGVDLRFEDGDLTLQTVRESRTELPPEEDLSGSGGRSADWKLVVRECESALAKRTKDLELAGYLTEAWARTRGIDGLTDGLLLVDKLLTDFWDTLHPGVDEGEIILPIRARYLTWLGSTPQFLQSAGAAQLFRTPDGKAIALRARQDAEWLADVRITQPDRYESLAKGKLGLDALNAIIARLPPTVLSGACEAVKSARAALAALQQTCDKLFPNDESPNLFPLRDLLEDAERFVSPKQDDARDEDRSEPSAALETGGARASGTPAGGPAGPLASRAEALARLREVAEYFKRTEPHSPVSYLVARAMRWGEMPLEGVLKEVVKDSNTLDQIWDLLGIKAPEA
jgi:type VI secretion system protein ImpA